MVDASCVPLPDTLFPSPFYRRTIIVKYVCVSPMHNFLFILHAYIFINNAFSLWILNFVQYGIALCIHFCTCFFI